MGYGKAVALFEDVDKNIQTEEEIKQEQVKKIEDNEKNKKMTESEKERGPFKAQTIGAPILKSDVVKGGRFEFSTAASFNRNEVSFEDYSDTITTFSIPVRLGFFITNFLEIEPELIYSHLSRNDATATTLLLFGNLALNFKISPRFVLFVLGGPGINWTSADSNGVIEGQQSIAYNGGGGIKVIFGSAALRLGYGIYFYSRDDSELDLEMDFLVHRAFVGISLFF